MLDDDLTDKIKYLGPTWIQLTHLFLLLAVNSMTVFAIFILLLRTIYTLALNTTTIESWEIERHEALVQRARPFGGFLDAPGGVQVRIQKQEFPYDVGIWENIKAGMGSGNVSLFQLSIQAYQSNLFGSLGSRMVLAISKDSRSEDRVELSSE